ncbi:MAG: hypothetical protein AAB595_01995 [Patescibacteria group bacterium]
MTAKSKLVVGGEITVVEKKTTITTKDGISTTNVVETSSTKSPSAGDLELKTTELKARRDVAKPRWWSSFWAPTYYGSWTTYSGPGGQNYIYSH